MACNAEKLIIDDEEISDSLTDSDKLPTDIKYQYLFFLLNLLILNVATGLMIVLIKQMDIWEYYSPFLNIYLISVGCMLFSAYIVICIVTIWSNYIVNVNRKRHYQYYSATMMALLTFLSVLSFVGYLCAGMSVEIVSSTIHNGMIDYPQNPLIKNAIDKMQITLKCCGVHRHTDWYGTAFKKVPFSCCPTEETSSREHAHCLDYSPSRHRDSCLTKLVEMSMNGITVMAYIVGILVLLMGIALKVSIKLTRLSTRGYYVRDA